MAASFPTSVNTFATLVDLVDSALASHQNDRGLEITAIENYLIESATEVTVSSGTLTVTKSRHKVQPESSTTDDIDTISGIPDGGVLILRASDAGTDTLTLKHGTGNLSCFGAANISLSTGFVICWRNGSTVYVAGDGGGGKKTVFCLVADSATTPTATGDGKVHFMIPPELNGMNLVDADAVVTTVSSSGTPTFAVRRERSGSAVDMLSTNITIDANEKTSYTAATAPVINTSNDDVATGDIIYIDLDTIGTGAKGHGVILSFQ